MISIPTVTFGNKHPNPTEKHEGVLGQSVTVRMTEQPHEPSIAIWKAAVINSVCNKFYCVERQRLQLILHMDGLAVIRLLDAWHVL